MANLLDQLLASGTMASLGLVAYHHCLYPYLGRRFARSSRTIMSDVYAHVPGADADVPDLPMVTIIVPAYEEADLIAEKVQNLAALDYPPDRMRIVIACDGCTDGTAEICRNKLREQDCAHLDATVVEHTENRGKVAILNEAILGAESPLIILTDVSAMIPRDAVSRIVAHFRDPRVGAAGGSYRVRYPVSAGEVAYWSMQIGVKQVEADLGAPMGLHGAFLAFRRVAWRPLPLDTINDDFVMPMRMVLDGWRVTYDPKVVAEEIERIEPRAEARRRRRIAAGNMQQLLRLPGLLHPRLGGVAFAFASGKALRVVLPYLMAFALIGSLTLCSGSVLFTGLAALQVTALLVAAIGAVLADRAPRLFAVAHYLAAGHLMNAIGSLRFLLRQHRRPWGRASVIVAGPDLHVPRAVAVTKRVADIVVATTGLLISAPLWPLIALAIRLDSPGPVLFRQLRIGRALPDRTLMFEMIKFRSMRSDAEARTGAVWATKNDARVTRVGLFLRKTRLDEIPQLINVLRGEMSIVGPRPERPGIQGRLEQAVPFFAERTSGLRPGITGLAQVNQGYDRDIEDVRRKVLFDHAYAMRLSKMRHWVCSDFDIICRTVFTMALGRGQ